MTKRKDPKDLKRRGPKPKVNWLALRKKFFEYIVQNDIPIVAEFAYQNGYDKSRLYDIPELSEPLKACIQKKETNLEKGALSGDVNCTMAIFSLKQIGWRDVQTNEITGKNGGPIELSGAKQALMRGLLPQPADRGKAKKN